MTFKDFLGNDWTCECMGCSIGKGEILPPGGLLYESNYFIMHQDPEIPIEGFLIISPKFHVKSLIEFNMEQRHELIDIMNLGISLLKKQNITNEVTIVQEEKSKHFHVWLFPWHPWMNEKFKKGISSLREINSYAATNVTQEEIKQIIQSISLLKEKALSQLVVNNPNNR